MTIESDSFNSIHWASGSVLGVPGWKFHFYLNDIKDLSSSLKVVFRHVTRSANKVVEVLTKQGVSDADFKSLLV